MGFHLSTSMIVVLYVTSVCSQFDESEQNFVSEEPYVNCAADAIYVKLKTNRTFEGHVQVKFVVQKSCYQVLVTNNQIEVLVPHQECAVPRRRSHSPAGVLLEIAISVSFHPDFTTADDRIFHLRCFHQRASNGRIQGPGSPTEPPRDSIRTPSCSYTVRKWPNGPLVGTVFLGQVVFHQWSCENQQDTCLVVHSCSVFGGETKHELMDEDGCSKNTKILPNLVYLNPSLVGQNVSVFGVSQTSLIYFECILLLVPKTDGICVIPECLDSVNRTRRSFDADVNTSVEVQSQRIEVSELVGTANDDRDGVQPMEFTCHERSSESENQICVPFNPFVGFLACFTSVIVIAAFAALMLSLQRYRHYSMSQAHC